MRIVEPSVEIMRTGLEAEFMTPEQFIEKVGRTCYKSEDKITDDSAAKFVGNLIKRGHEAMIEHWNLIYEFACHEDYMNFAESKKSIEEVTGTHFRLRVTDREDRRYVSGNMRAWRDYIKTWINVAGFIPHSLFVPIKEYPIFFSEFQDRVPENINNPALISVSVKDLPDIDRKVHQDVTVKFVCDRGVSHEIVRHRVASFAQESTRYCNYGLDKFGNEITVVRPSWCSKADDKYEDWRSGCCTAEGAYFTMLADGATPQEARSVLPNSTKTEIIVTMNLDGWDHFFGLRCALDAHPDMREVACMAKNQFAARGVSL